jgi:hypothetical protein
VSPLIDRPPNCQRSSHRFGIISSSEDSIKEDSL